MKSYKLKAVKRGGYALKAPVKKPARKGGGGDIKLTSDEERRLDKVWDDIGKKNPPPYAKKKK